MLPLMTTLLFLSISIAIIIMCFYFLSHASTPSSVIVIVWLIITNVVRCKRICCRNIVLTCNPNPSPHPHRPHQHRPQPHHSQRHCQQYHLHFQHQDTQVTTSTVSLIIGGAYDEGCGCCSGEHDNRTAVACFGAQQCRAVAMVWPRGV